MQLLTGGEVQRYSRQLLLPSFEVEGQLALKNASVIVVGAGGLGCPVAIYLAGAGVGKIGIVDYDVVDMSNLHRQIMHSEARLGINKALSLGEECRRLNSSIVVLAIQDALTSENALSVLQDYDVVVDATDNVATRYLLNDAAVRLHKPLVSGSALRWEGQLTTYHCTDEQGELGPCYRCLFPTPPPAASVTNCNDGGVLGCVTGILGSWQALEVIHLLMRRPSYVGKMLLLDAFPMARIPSKTIRLRRRRNDCEACSREDPVLLIDYKAFCGTGYSDGPLSVSALPENHRITPELFHLCRDTYAVLDVREPLQFKITSLKDSTNIPLEDMTLESVLASFSLKEQEIVCVCRRGNDSQWAVMKLHEWGYSNAKDLTGGLNALARLDPSLARY